MNRFYFSCALFACFLTLLCAEEIKKPGCLDKEEALTLLKTASEFLSKANAAYPTCKNESECGGKLPLSYIKISQNLISDVRANFPTCGSKEILQSKKPKDCSEILANGFNQSGVYTIWPRESCTIGNQLQVYCDMKTDYGGWTVIQRRGKFPVQQNFDQKWESYKNGFGNISEEFWLGNENIRVLCYKGCELRFDLQANNGTKGYAVYKNFNLTRNSYTIYARHYVGDVGDSMQYHNYWPFSTKDKQNTGLHKQPYGGWWYNNSTYASLNGLYQPGRSGYEGMVWFTWQRIENLANVEIKVRPN